MDWKNPKSVETTISRLKKEIEQIDAHFYFSSEEDDRVLHAGMLERKRDDMVRSAVLQLHTSIEDLLNSFITCRVLGVKPQERRVRTRSHAARALRKLLFGAGSLGFDMKLNLALVVGILSARTKDRLMELNTLRNRCSHNWLLKAPSRVGRRPGQKKPPLLLYKGQDLHQVKVLKQFTAEFGQIYYRLFARYLALHDA